MRFRLNEEEIQSALFAEDGGEGTLNSTLRIERYIWTWQVYV